MSIFKELLNSFKKTEDNMCKCKRSDKCTCPCHTNPGVMHIINCCSVKKCGVCGKDYNGVKTFSRD